MRRPILLTLLLSIAIACSAQLQVPVRKEPAPQPLSEMRAQGGNSGSSDQDPAAYTVADTGQDILGQTGSDYLAKAQNAGSTQSPGKATLADSAIAFIQQALPLYLQRGALNQYQKALKDLSDAYVLKDDYTRALEAYQKHVIYRDSVFDNEYSKTLQITESRYALQKARDSLRADGEQRTMALKKKAELAALRYEYAQKQAMAKTEAERRQISNEEELKRRKLEDRYDSTAKALAYQRQREEAINKARADKRAELNAAELDRKKAWVQASVAGSALLLFGATVMLLAYRGKRRTALVIAREQHRNQVLLHNILPARVVEEINSTGGSPAKLYEQVSVLVTDFVNFSGVAEHHSPEELVRELHECFSAFDLISERYGLEKIKTIGDAYLAVCGLPEPNPRHAQAVVNAALEIRDFMSTRGKKYKTFEIRIGVHSGPVVAGIVGLTKYGFDIWGETVKLADRMEREGEPGVINISETTLNLLGNEFETKPRGTESQSGIQMYRVERLRIRKASS